MQRGQRGRWNLDRCGGRGFVLGFSGWDSQSEALSESEEMEEEWEVGPLNPFINFGHSTVTGRCSPKPHINVLYLGLGM